MAARADQLIARDEHARQLEVGRHVSDRNEVGAAAAALNVHQADRLAGRKADHAHPEQVDAARRVLFVTKAITASIGTANATILAR